MTNSHIIEKKKKKIKYVSDYKALTVTSHHLWNFLFYFFHTSHWLTGRFYNSHLRGYLLATFSKEKAFIKNLSISISDYARETSNILIYCWQIFIANCFLNCYAEYTSYKIYGKKLHLDLANNLKIWEWCWIYL